MGFWFSDYANGSRVSFCFLAPFSGFDVPYRYLLPGGSRGVILGSWGRSLIKL
jgi:hypothetical protein